MKALCCNVLLACCLALRCVGPDIGSSLQKAKNSSSTTVSDCSFCLQQPQLTLPVNHAATANTLQNVTIAPITAEACEYAFSGAVTLTALKLKSAGSITDYTPAATWPLDQLIQVAVRCFDSENTASAKVTATGSADFTVSLATPQVQNPWTSYITTSNLVRFKSSAHSVATLYEWEVKQGVTTVYAGTSTVADSVAEIPFPPAAYGNFSVRTRYRDANSIYSAYSDAVNFVIKDRSAGTTIYSQDFTAMSTCGDLATLLIMLCNGINIFAPPPNCNSAGWYGGGGNAWMCESGFEGTVVLQINNSAMNLLGFFNGELTTVNVTNASIEVENHQHGNSEDAAATVIACRASPANGSEGFSFVIYPYRTSGKNVEIRNRKFSDNSYSVIGDAYRSEAQLPNRTFFRFDCLDAHFTGYYKNSSGKWFPLVQAQSAVIAASPHHVGLGTGQGNQIIKLRNYSLNLKELP